MISLPSASGSLRIRSRAPTGSAMSPPGLEPPLLLEALCDGSAGLRRVLAVMARPQEVALGGIPPSLHGFGLAAADSLNVGRQAVAASLGADPNGLILLGGTEAGPSGVARRWPAALPPAL